MNSREFRRIFECDYPLVLYLYCFKIPVFYRFPFRSLFKCMHKKHYTKEKSSIFALWTSMIADWFFYNGIKQYIRNCRIFSGRKEGRRRKLLRIHIALTTSHQIQKWILFVESEHTNLQTLPHPLYTDSDWINFTFDGL